uniref:Uncharacterized protein n=1 Tax=Ixodes scapularis TaxID=6945 RepID=A0A4D5RBH2_IXOSC
MFLWNVFVLKLPKMVRTICFVFLSACSRGNHGQASHSHCVVSRNGFCYRFLFICFSFVLFLVEQIQCVGVLFISSGRRLSCCI